jgi:hypothetical protein
MHLYGSAQTRPIAGCGAIASGYSAILTRAVGAIVYHHCSAAVESVRLWRLGTNRGRQVAIAVVVVGIQQHIHYQSRNRLPLMVTLPIAGACQDSHVITAVRIGGAGAELVHSLAEYSTRGGWWGSSYLIDAAGGSLERSLCDCVATADRH